MLTIDHEKGSRYLSPEELNVLGYLVQGYSNQEIATNRQVSVHTVKTQVKDIYGKLGLENGKHSLTRMKALLKALELGICNPTKSNFE